MKEENKKKRNFSLFLYLISTIVSIVMVLVLSPQLKLINAGSANFIKSEDIHLFQYLYLIVLILFLFLIVSNSYLHPLNENYWKTSSEKTLLIALSVVIGALYWNVFGEKHIFLLLCFLLYYLYLLSVFRERNKKKLLIIVACLIYGLIISIFPLFVFKITYSFKNLNLVEFYVFLNFSLIAMISTIFGLNSVSPHIKTIVIALSLCSRFFFFWFIFLNCRPFYGINTLYIWLFETIYIILYIAWALFFYFHFTKQNEIEQENLSKDNLS